MCCCWLLSGAGVDSLSMLSRLSKTVQDCPDSRHMTTNTSIFIAILSVPWVNTSIPILSVIGINTLTGPYTDQTGDAWCTRYVTVRLVPHHLPGRLHVRRRRSGVPARVWSPPGIMVRGDPLQWLLARGLSGLPRRHPSGAAAAPNSRVLFG